MKHTPGPWKAISEKWYLDSKPTIAAEDGHGLVIAHVAHDGMGNYAGQLGEPMADAQLIAAAPDLLEVVKLLLAWAHIQDNGHPQSIQIRDKAEAAIAKAKGEENDTPEL